MGVPFETWNYKGQTRMKHLVFADYFDKWVKILGKYYKLNFIGGFGGCGAYDDNGEIKYGSPILAAQVTKSNNKDVKLVVVDNKKRNIDNLIKIFKYLKLNVKPTFVNADFDKTVNEILDSADGLAPTFFLIDPFGYKIKMSTLRRIMAIPKAEILLNFMFNAVTRWLNYDLLESTYNDLFGCGGWKVLKGLHGDERESEIVNLYRSKLKEFSKFVCPFKMMFEDKARTYYYLFHLTNNIKGCEIMKSCFAKYNYGRIEYKGKLSKQMSLFDLPEMKIAEAKKVILNNFNAKEKYLDILEALIDETVYLLSDIYTAIKELENENKITVERNPPTTPKTGKPRKSINQETDYIIFS